MLINQVIVISLKSLVNRLPADFVCAAGGLLLGFAFPGLFFHSRESGKHKATNVIPGIPGHPGITKCMACSTPEWRYGQRAWRAIVYV